MLISSASKRGRDASGEQDKGQIISSVLGQLRNQAIVLKCWSPDELESFCNNSEEK